VVVVKRSLGFCTSDGGLAGGVNLMDRYGIVIRVSKLLLNNYAGPVDLQA
jgi:hypothetical protein